MNRYTKILLAGTAAASLILVATTQANATSDPTDPLIEAAEEQAAANIEAVQQSDKIVPSFAASSSRVQVSETESIELLPALFEHSVTLPDAIDATAGLENVVAYRFSGGGVQGEFSLATGISVDEYLQGFYDDYGTQPQIVAAIVQMPATTDASRSSEPVQSLPVVAVDAPEFVADEMTYGEAWEPATTAQEEAALQSDVQARGAARYPDWIPESASVFVTKKNGLPQFKEFYLWSGPGQSPALVPAHWGIEMEVNLFNGAAPGSRPLTCAGEYKAQFFAINQHYTWSVGYGSSPAIDPTPYADYNDLFDECNRNSMSIGVMLPQLHPGASNGMPPMITVDVIAPKGTQTSNRMSANLQAVWDSGCQVNGVALTDCMGLFNGDSNWNSWFNAVGAPIPSKARPVLNYNNAKMGPGYCWGSNGYGESPSFAITCPAST